MGKQNSNNLHRMIKDYSQSGLWVNNVVMGSILVLSGLMVYFKIVWWDLLYGVSFLCWVFVSQRLSRTIGLDSAKQKVGIAEFSWKQALLIIIPWLTFILLFILKNWDKKIIYPITLLGPGFIAIIIGFINQKRFVVYNTFYSVIFFVICLLMLILVLPLDFYTREIAPLGITMASFGLLLILSSIISHFKYKNIALEVNGTN
jgi:hypothetical protein